MRVAKLAVDQTGGLILGLVIGAVLFFGGFILATQVMDAGATHDANDNIHACINRYTTQARIMTPGQAPNCTPYETLVEWAASGTVIDIEARVTALEAQVPDCMSDIGGDAVFSGCNVQIVNGTGSTNTTNSKGNLIVGYNENPLNNPQTGSHNIVVGLDHTFTAYGGFIAGFPNTLSNDFASVTGGTGNTASGLRSTVSGGNGNTASGVESSVSGGLSNVANANQSSVSGGQSNIASGGASSVSGGQNNQATNANASVSGGNMNTASGGNSSVTGGQMNTASGTNAAVNGGVSNQAQNGNSTVSGGNTNIANNNNSTVSGGQNRTSTSANDWTGGGLNQPN